MGKLVLVGAGPGDPGLITIKGAKAIGQADVILYDALVHESLLEYRCMPSLLIYVGKRAMESSISQVSINDLILYHLRRNKVVVRLKGGDPFVFGRGFEELTIAREQGFEVEIIPGLSSSTAIPALLGVPLTLRSANHSFYVTTARQVDGDPVSDLPGLLSIGATVVVLMGLSRLNSIASRLIESGFDRMPVLVVQDGSLPSQKEAYGTAEHIVEITQQRSIGTPAIIIIGKSLEFYKTADSIAELA